MLTVGTAQLADFVGRDKSRATPAVTLHLDGRQAAVVDSFQPHRTISVTAKWDGDRLQIDSRLDPTATTQFLSLEEAQLVVVNVTYLNGERRSEVTFKYNRKRRTARS
jgi:hypothetical protein